MAAATETAGAAMVVVLSGIVISSIKEEQRAASKALS